MEVMLWNLENKLDDMLEAFDAGQHDRAKMAAHEMRGLLEDAKVDWARLKAVDEEVYRTVIEPQPEELGGGWRLRLIEEVGSKAYNDYEEASAAAEAWLTNGKNTVTES